MTIQERVAKAMENYGVLQQSVDGDNVTYEGMGNDKTFTTEIKNDAYEADSYVDMAVLRIIRGMSGT